MLSQERGECAAHSRNNFGLSEKLVGTKFHPDPTPCPASGVPPHTLPASLVAYCAPTPCQLHLWRTTPHTLPSCSLPLFLHTKLLHRLEGDARRDSFSIARGTRHRHGYLSPCVYGLFSHCEGDVDRETLRCQVRLKVEGEAQCEGETRL